MNLHDILDWRDPIEIRHVVNRSEGIRFHLVTAATSFRCPRCGQLSSRQHSCYQRWIADLPWAGKQVEVYLQQQRFFCNSAACAQRTFAVRLTSVHRYARQTKSLQDQLVLIASQLGGRAGVKLATLMDMPNSRDVLIRLLTKRQEANICPPKVLGVDDWSLKKGTTARQPLMLPF